MFLRCKVRRKDGKQHRYWSVVENTRVAGGRVVQRHVLYLGEINDTQELEWRRSIAVLEDGAGLPRTLSLFPEDRCEDCCRMLRSSASSCRNCGCAGRGSGARAGWHCCCGGSCSWINSGASGSARAAKGRAGIRSCLYWSPIACWRRAANGGCTVNGFSAALWPIC